MSTFKRICSLLLCALLLLSMIPMVAVSAADAPHITVDATASQQRRMWCTQNYSTADYTYTPWNPTAWGRVHYVRFATNEQLDCISKAVIKFNARARASEKTVFVAALALSDTMASRVETDLSALNATLIKTGTGTTAISNKLMTDQSGYYLSEVASSVVAYGKFTASDAATTESIHANAEGTIVYEYPLDIELDVTTAVQQAFAAGKNHVQFVLMTPKDVYIESTNLGDAENFSEYQNGTVYDTDGGVLYSNVSTAKLDTSLPVCGSADYYTPATKLDDDYFSWMYLLQDSIRLEIDTIPPEQAFAAFQAKTTDGASFAKGVKEIAYLLSDGWEDYQKISTDTALNNALYAALQNATISAFQQSFAQTVAQYYWQGYALRLNTVTSFGGLRGSISLEGENIPELSYVQLTAYNSADRAMYTETLAVKNGVGAYNLYGKAQGAAYLTLQTLADESGTTAIAALKTVTLSDVVLPDVFITEITNRHTVTYYADGSSQNGGANEQKFQYIELYNYSDKTVDLREYTFVYTDTAEHTFDWITETKGSLLLQPGEQYIIGVYAADSAAKGYAYNNDTALAAYWKAFNAFYNVNIPITNRTLIACVASGDGATTLDGITRLQRSCDVGVTVTAELRKGNETVTKVSLPDEGSSKANSSFAYQFVPGDTAAINEEFLFCTGCFPYQLLKDQDLSYCEQAYLNGTPMLKVMSYNILATDTTVNGVSRKISERLPLLLQTIQEYQPDIIGMQEYNYQWVDLLHDTGKMPSNYSVVQGLSTKNHTFADASGTWDLLNPIYYRNDKFDLLDSGAAFLTPDGLHTTKQWDSINMTRTITWVVLRNKATGEVTNVVNTHLILSGKQGRVEQVKLVYQKGAELQAKYGGGIITMGDHNMVENSEPYQAYVNGGVVVDSKYQTTNHNSISSCTNFKAKSETYGGPIDFIFVSPEEYIVNKYKVVDGVYPSNIVSDHSGVYLELYNRNYEDTDTPVITGVQEGKTYCESVTFQIKENYIRSATLNGVKIEYPESVTLTNPGTYAVEVVDMAGRTASVNFTLAKHSYPAENWQVTVAPTCGAAGKRTNICEYCSEPITASLPATGKHTPSGENNVTKTPTCASTGRANNVCAVCNNPYEIILPVTDDHTWESEYTVDKQATCTTVGSKSIHCAVCDATKEDSIIVIPVAHIWETSYTVDQKATCTVNGSKSIHCSLCDASKPDSAVTIPASHTPGAWVQTKAPTYTTEGQKVQKCSVCDATLKTQTIAKLTGADVVSVFTDLKAKDWYVKNGAIGFAYNQGLFKGTSDTTFGPDDPMTRAMFVTVLGRLHGVQADNKAATPFTDVLKGQYYVGYVKWANANGIVKGTSNTTFSPDANVTREQICAMMLRYCDFADITLQKVNPAMNFADAKKISGYARAAVTACQRGGIVNGKEGGKFDPLGNATRAEVATILMNFSKNYLA